MILYEIISKKRDGGRNTAREIEFLIDGFTKGDVTEAQMAAWLMAVYIHGLELTETAYLAKAMAESGAKVDLSVITGPIADKHSTGGVGDKATLVVTPLVAAAGVKVPKLSGRALGHTGGTLDKLEAIPGFRTCLTDKEITSQVNEIGAVIAAQTQDLAPADKKIYALRDQTATVASIPLITASILSKKVAGGATAVLIDVKVGSGAFMREPALAKELAAVLTGVGQGLGLRVKCLLSDMNQPLGLTVGNALELREAIDCLSGGGPSDLRELCLRLAAEMLIMGDKHMDLDTATRTLSALLDGGQALAKFEEVIKAQGGDERVLYDPCFLAPAPLRYVYRAKRGGRLHIKDCARLGMAAAILMGGHLGQPGAVDRSAGLVMLAKQGDIVKADDPVLELHYSKEDVLEGARALIDRAVTVTTGEPPVSPLIYKNPGGLA